MLVAVPLEEFVHFTYGPVYIFVDVVQAHVRSTAHFVHVFGFAGGVVVGDGQGTGVFQGFFSIDTEVWGVEIRGQGNPLVNGADSIKNFGASWL